MTGQARPRGAYEAGECIIRRDSDGSLTALQADDHIRVSRELLKQAEDGTGDLRRDGDVLCIPTTPPLHYRMYEDGDPHSLGATKIAKGDYPPATIKD